MYNFENSIRDIRPFCILLFCRNSVVRYTLSLLQQWTRNEIWLPNITEIAHPNITGWTRTWMSRMGCFESQQKQIKGILVIGQKGRKVISCFFPKIWISVWRTNFSPLLFFDVRSGFYPKDRVSFSRFTFSPTWAVLMATFIGRNLFVLVLFLTPTAIKAFCRNWKCAVWNFTEFVHFFPKTWRAIKGSSSISEMELTKNNLFSFLRPLYSSGVLRVICGRPFPLACAVGHAAVFIVNAALMASQW